MKRIYKCKKQNKKDDGMVGSIIPGTNQWGSKTAASLLFMEHGGGGKRFLHPVNIAETFIGYSSTQYKLSSSFQSSCHLPLQNSW